MAWSYVDYDGQALGTSISSLPWSWTRNSHNLLVWLSRVTFFCIILYFSQWLVNIYVLYTSYHISACFISLQSSPFFSCVLHFLLHKTLNSFSHCSSLSSSFSLFLPPIPPTTAPSPIPPPPHLCLPLVRRCCPPVLEAFHCCLTIPPDIIHRWWWRCWWSCWWWWRWGWWWWKGPCRKRLCQRCQESLRPGVAIVSCKYDDDDHGGSDDGDNFMVMIIVADTYQLWVKTYVG